MYRGALSPTCAYPCPDKVDGTARSSGCLTPLYTKLSKELQLNIFELVPAEITTPYSETAGLDFFTRQG